MKVFSFIILFTSVCLGETEIQSLQIERFVEKYIRNNITDTTKEILVEFRNIPSRITVPCDEYSLRIVDEIGSAFKGNISLPIEIICGRNLYRRLIVSVKIRTFENVLVASTFINRNETVLNDKITFKKIETTTLPNDVIKESSELNGKRTRRIINEGSILFGSSLENQPAVKRHNILDLVVNTRYVKITTKVIAKEDADINEIISVEEIGSRKKLKAVVLNNKTVEIKLD